VKKRESIYYLHSIIKKYLNLIEDIVDTENSIKFYELNNFHFDILNIKNEKKAMEFHGLYENFQEDLIGKKYELFQKQKRLSLNQRQKSASYFIYIHSLFETYRGKLRRDAFLFSDNAKDHFIEGMNLYAASRKFKFNDEELWKYTKPKNHKDIPDHLWKLKSDLFKIEKMAYGFLPPKLHNEENILFENTKEIFDKYIILREVRNLIAHRGDEIDDQLKKQINSGVTKFKDIRKQREYISTLANQLRLNSLKKVYKAKEDNSGDEYTLNLYAGSLIQTIKILSSIGFTSELSCFDEKEDREITLEVLSDIINQLLILYSKYKVYDLLKVSIDLIYLIYKSFEDINDYADDIFLVNSILVFKEVISLEETTNPKEPLYDVKDLQKRLDSSIKIIKDDHIKNIVTNYINYNIQEFLSSIKKYALHTESSLKNKEKFNYNALNDWYMVQSLMGLPTIHNFIISSKSTKKALEDSKSESESGSEDNL
jgi:hypothetical protein